VTDSPQAGSSCLSPTSHDPSQDGIPNGCRAVIGERPCAAPDQANGAPNGCEVVKTWCGCSEMASGAPAVVAGAAGSAAAGTAPAAESAEAVAASNCTNCCSWKKLLRHELKQLLELVKLLLLKMMLLLLKLLKLLQLLHLQRQDIEQLIERLGADSSAAPYGQAPHGLGCPSWLDPIPSVVPIIRTSSFFNGLFGAEPLSETRRPAHCSQCFVLCDHEISKPWLVTWRTNCARSLPARDAARLLDDAPVGFSENSLVMECAQIMGRSHTPISLGKG